MAGWGKASAHTLVQILKTSEDIAIDGKEHSEYGWCGIEKALQLLIWKENKEALEKLNAILGS